MSLPNQEKLLDALRSGKLTAAEEVQLEACLAQDPTLRAACEEDGALNHLLSSLPDAPVSTNFTAQVLHAVESLDRPAPRGSSWFPWRVQNWALKLAVVTLAISAGFWSFVQQQAATRRERASTLVQVTSLAQDTPLEVFQNFDVIERLNQVPHDVDRELIAALQ
jgi:anti-sigma factor RsiW